MKKVKWLGVLLGLALLIGGAMWGMSRMYRGMFGNNHYYQRSRAYTTQDGLLNQKMRSARQMRQLTALTHGTRYTGNWSLDQAATTYHYRVGQDNISNFMGADATLQLYTTSKLMTPAKVRAAATFWNRLAGQRIVQVVDTAKRSDEVIHDAQPAKKDTSLGGQTYDRQGMVFYPQNWRSSGLSATERADWQQAVLIREIGHALGIPSLAGGSRGTNAFDHGKIGAEVMGYWSVGSAAPKANRHGITSTKMDGAALALAALSWKRPQRLADWVFTQHPVVVHVHAGQVSTK